MQDVIHRRYQEIANEITKGYTLKTDVWQETRDEDEAPIKADCYVEILPHLVAKAKEMGLNVKQGSIEDLPFDDKLFDTVIDTSTIDHTENYAQVIKEYRRVMKDDGVLLLIAWTTPGDTLIDGTDLAGGQQFYFNRFLFKADLKEQLDIISEEVLRDAGNRQLVSYICKAKV